MVMMNYDHTNSICLILSTKFRLFGELYFSGSAGSNFLILLGPRPLVAFKNVDKGGDREMIDMAACIGCCI